MNLCAPSLYRLCKAGTITWSGDLIDNYQCFSFWMKLKNPQAKQPQLHLLLQYLPGQHLPLLCLIARMRSRFWIYLCIFTESAHWIGPQNSELNQKKTFKKKKNWFWYPHWSKDSVSPVCGIFSSSSKCNDPSSVALLYQKLIVIQKTIYRQTSWPKLHWCTEVLYQKYLFTIYVTHQTAQGRDKTFYTSRLFIKACLIEWDKKADRLNEGNMTLSKADRLDYQHNTMEMYLVINMTMS